MDRDRRVEPATAAECRARMNEICALYDEVFSTPPFVWPEGESDNHRSMLQRLTSNPSFAIALASAEDELIGFVYGVPLEQNTNWWNGFQRPVSPEFTQEWPGRTFAIIDLAVRADHRRHGLGRRLMNTLLESRAEQRATLAVQPQSADSHAFYRALGGWRLVGRQDTPEYVSAQFDIYVLEPTKP